MDIVTRVFLLVSSWLIMVALTVFVIGLERKHAWFRQRDQTKSFLNRRGFVGEYIHLGYPRTRQGWVIWSIFMLVIILSTYLLIFP